MIQVPAGSHSLWLVVVPSVLLGGWLGMILNRQIAKGIICLLAGFLITSVSCGTGFFPLYVLMLIDAILIARKLNRGEAVRDWEFF